MTPNSGCLAYPAAEPDFGRYLQSVAERDIDLLLMEEFHITPAFCSWFADRVAIEPGAVFDGAWHSLNDQDGETDLLLRVRLAGERVAMLIENKIAAPEQNDRLSERRETGPQERSGMHGLGV